MAQPDPTQEFLASLPEIKKDTVFWFGCHPDVPCFNACCSDLTMPLTPYDVLRLRRGLSMGSDAFIEEYAVVTCYPDTGFPLMHLRMEEPPLRQCPFLLESGCGIYDHRSSACRTYPLGRAVTAEDTAPGTEGKPILKERYFLVREEHCKGFAEQKEWTIDTWLSDQGLIPYTTMNDRYMQVISRYKQHANNAILSSKHATMALLCLYQQDNFLDFINAVNLLDKIRFIGEWDDRPEHERQDHIRTDEEQRLLFGLAWIELILLGSSTCIAPR